MKSCVILIGVALLFTNFSLLYANSISEKTLTNGIRVVMDYEPGSPLVAVNVFVLTGNTTEDDIRPGIADLVARTLLRGTTNQTTETIDGQIGSLGGNFSVDWSRDYTEIKSLTLADRLDDVSYIIGDLLKNATFDDSAVSDAKVELKQDIQSNSSDIFDYAYNEARSRLFHGRGLVDESTNELSTLKSLQPDDVRNFYHRYYTAENIVVVMAGGIDPDHMYHAVNQNLSDLDRHSLPNRKLLLGSFASNKLPLVTNKSEPNLNSSYILSSFRVPGYGQKDSPACMVASALLGGLKTSLLFRKFRETDNVAYETASIYGEQLGVTDLTSYVITANDSSPSDDSVPSLTTLKDELIDQYRILRETEQTAVMLNRAKKYVIGSFLIRHERLQDRAYWLGLAEVSQSGSDGYKLDQDYISIVNSVSSDDVKHAANEYMTSGMVVVIVQSSPPNAGEVSR